MKARASASTVAVATATAAAAGRVLLRRSVKSIKTRSKPLIDPLYELPTDVEQFDVTSPDGAHIHVMARGRGRPILLIHGITLRGEVWAPQMHLLADRYRLYAMDVRGHGRSTVGSAGLGRAAAASDIAAVIDSLDLTEAVIVGHSMGGMILMEFAGRYRELVQKRVSGLVFMDTAASGLIAAPFAPLARAVGRVLNSRVESGGTPLSGLSGESDFAWLVARLGFGAQPSGRAVEQMRRFQSQALPSTVIPSGIDLIDHDARWALAATSTPSLVLVGSRDLLTPVRQARKIAKLLPNARLEVIPLAGHQLMQERPREVSALIDEFAESLYPILT